MADSPSELNYTTIDRPYDGSLSRVNDGAEAALSPSLLQGGADPTGNGASINTNNKIVASGTEFDDVWLNTWIKSRNYLPKTRGFFIDAMAGYIEAMDVFVSGDITASTGSIGGFVIGADYLRDLANSFGLASTVTGVDDVRFWAGSTFEMRDSAPFRITEAGVLTAQSGTIGGWTITSSTLTATGIILDAGNQRITVGSSTPSIIIDGINKNVRTSTYASGTEGWSITKDGDAEFNDITARGEFHTQVLSYGSVHVTAGSNLLALSGGTLKYTISSIDNGGSAALESGLTDVILLESGTTDELLLEDSFSLAINDPPTGHLQVFAVNDVLRIKDGSGNDGWFTVVSVVDETTHFSYTCTKSSGSNATFYAGAAVADYGQSGQGLIFSTVDSANSPYISVQTHAGSPWSAITQHVRMGNLNGFLDYATDLYGFAVGSSTGTSANITIDPTNGIRIRNGTTSVVSLDNAGNVSVNTITAVAGTIAAFTIASTTISATNLTLTSGAANTANITVGTGSTAAGLNSANTGTDIAFWAGSTFADRASASFRVNAQGDLVATSATISGSISATTGTIGGFDVGADYIRDTVNSFGMASTVSGADDVRFWAGDSFTNRATAPFRILESGAFTSAAATISGGTISNTSTVSGQMGTTLNNNTSGIRINGPSGVFGTPSQSANSLAVITGSTNVLEIRPHSGSTESWNIYATPNVDDGQGLISWTSASTSSIAPFGSTFGVIKLNATHASGAQNLISLINAGDGRSIHIAHTGTTYAPIIVSGGTVSTNFKKIIRGANRTIWEAINTTSPNSNLSGTAGDLCMSGDGNIYRCTGTTNWTAM